MTNFPFQCAGCQDFLQLAPHSHFHSLSSLVAVPIHTKGICEYSNPCFSNCLTTCPWAPSTSKSLYGIWHLHHLKVYCPESTVITCKDKQMGALCLGLIMWIIKRPLKMGSLVHSPSRAPSCVGFLQVLWYPSTLQKTCWKILGSYLNWPQYVCVCMHER